jgi:hypothetical protein
MVLEVLHNSIWCRVTETKARKANLPILDPQTAKSGVVCWLNLAGGHIRITRDILSSQVVRIP